MVEHLTWLGIWTSQLPEDQISESARQNLLAACWILTTTLWNIGFYSQTASFADTYPLN